MKTKQTNFTLPFLFCFEHNSLKFFFKCYLFKKDKNSWLKLPTSRLTWWMCQSAFKLFNPWFFYALLTCLKWLECWNLQVNFLKFLWKETSRGSHVLAKYKFVLNEWNFLLTLANPYLKQPVLIKNIILQQYVPTILWLNVNLFVVKIYFQFKFLEF